MDLAQGEVSMQPILRIRDDLPVATLFEVARAHRNQQR
jgi:hypothetical protein